MNGPAHGGAKRRRGFALVLTLALLALLVLAVWALSALVRTSAHVADGGARQVQARQHARLALALALGDLQAAAGDDARLTGMAGIAGVPPGLASTTRHWCGVWRADGSFVRWLTSGANANASLAGRSVELVGAGSVGHATTFSPNQEKEPVVAGLVPLPSASDPTAPRGDIAYIVLDEGVMFAPSFLGGAAKGMHGYGLSSPSCFAALASDHPLPDSCQSLADLAPLVRSTLGFGAAEKAQEG